ncbi:sensor histidine kinase [Paenibacillus daejeonensis]|uniref:sensor histidine kinase n=1 Tax=Paenibacillus daejeonensis TaxID=135193 RepID=UPI00037349E9|nr:histidine kinase [Paenibacillus daejeonensis]
MSPVPYVQGWRFLQIVALIHLWIAGDARPSLFLLILLLLILVCLRWRFPLPPWTAALDIGAAALFMPFTPLAGYALALPIFELALAGRWLLALPLAAGLLLAQGDPAVGLWFFAASLFFGGFARVSLRNERLYQQEVDEQRKARQELERFRTELLAAGRASAHQAELMERYRIARQLHDHLGHDLTGASLALQAYDYVKEPEEAAKLLAEVRRRIERSTDSLRETVHNATPVARIGIERLEQVVQGYGELGLHFVKTGDMQRIQAYQWDLLESCLKEALTNVARHSNATEVRIELQTGEAIVRLLVQDNGTLPDTGQPGTGLKNLQLRARALGGSLSISRGQGVLLVCVIPLEERGEPDEAADRG